MVAISLTLASPAAPLHVASLQPKEAATPADDESGERAGSIAGAGTAAGGTAGADGDPWSW